MPPEAITGASWSRLIGSLRVTASVLGREVTNRACPRLRVTSPTEFRLPWATRVSKPACCSMSAETAPGVGAAGSLW